MEETKKNKSALELHTTRPAQYLLRYRSVNFVRVGQPVVRNAARLIEIVVGGGRQ
jgi:hypothetical protein